MPSKPGIRSRKQSGSGHHHGHKKKPKQPPPPVVVDAGDNNVNNNRLLAGFNRTAVRSPTERRDRMNNLLAGPWSPSPSTAFKALLSARLCAAVWSNISDCDETFNYWEPAHYLIHGSGFQTWEYSPAFAIRSFAYLWVYALPAFIYSRLVQTNQLLVFYYTRCILGFCCALAEAYLYRGVTRQFGPSVARLFLFFMILATGMFISSTSFLPSSFSMYMTILAFGAWLQQHHKIVILTSAASALVGWPFAALLSLPIAIEMVVNKKKRLFFLKWSCIIGASITSLLIAIDSYYYGKLVLAPVNIVLYNVFSSHGANLYGTEPWTFYFVNCFLNFNLVFIFALVAPPVMVVCKFLIRSRRNLVNSSHLISVASLLLWLTVFFIQKHKEERFIFPAYPLICLNAALAVELIQKALANCWPRLVFFYSYLVLAVVMVFAFLSISRGLALYKGYHAPMDIYMELGRVHHDLNVTSLKHPVKLCLGKEWHRYPSSFFLPSAQHWNVSFIESEFRGQLPNKFALGPGATRLIPPDMNDQNREEPSRYIPSSECHFLIDTDSDEVLPRQPIYSRDEDNWLVVQSHPFLDAGRSPTLFRAFYVPFVTESRCSYVKYNLLRNKRLELE